MNLMKPQHQKPAGTADLFRSELEQIINPNHELVKLARSIDWEYLDAEVTPYFADIGRPALPSRLMIGLHILKHMYQLSDDRVLEAWIENPYYQCFCGEMYFQHTLPIRRSSMTHWRQRLGDDFFEKLLIESLRIAHKEQAIKTCHLKKVVVDTTVQPKAVHFPTDIRTMYRAMVDLNKLCKQHGLKLRQGYLRVGKRALVMYGRYSHAKQMKRAKRQEKFIRVRLGRILRDIRRQLRKREDLIPYFSEALKKAGIVHKQHRTSTEKLYSWHAPETECIGKGKVAKPYEFGCKVSVVTNNQKAAGGHFVLSIEALHGRPFDGHTLKPAIDRLKNTTGVTPTRIYVDKGYQGHHYEPRIHVFKSGQKRGVTASIRKELRRRSVVEPIIGHLKGEHHLGRNHLKGKQGDRINAVMSGVGYNFRLLLRWFRLYFAQFLNPFCVVLNQEIRSSCPSKQPGRINMACF
jgi:IS5 family transposase